MTIPRRIGRRASHRACALGIVLALGLAGCGGGGGGGDGGGAANPKGAPCPVDALDNVKGPVEIRFWHTQQRANLDELRRQTDAFNASQSKVHVTLVDQTGYKELLEKYKAGLRSGDLPDLAQFEETTVQTLIDSRSMVSMQSCVDRDHYSLSDFLPRAIDYYTVQGSLRSMPWNVSNPVLYYDKAKFRRAGLDPDKPPATFAEVKRDAERIVASGVAKHGISLRTEPYFNEFFYAKAGQVYVNNDGGRKARATKAELDNETGLAIWTWWKDMVSSGLALNTGSAEGNFDHLLALGTGDAAMSIDASSALGPIKAVLESGQYAGVEIGAAPLPSLRTGGGVPVGDGSLWIPAKGSPQKQAAAWQFVKYLVASEQLAQLSIHTGYIPIRKSSAESRVMQDYWAANPAFRVAYDQLLAGRGIAANGSVIGNYQGVRDAVRDGLTEMLTRGKSPAASLRDAQRKADAAITDYNTRISG